MKTKKLKKLLRLVKQWTRAEILARYSRFDNLEFADYFMIKIQIENKIRRLVFENDNLVSIGIKLGILKERKKK